MRKAKKADTHKCDKCKCKHGDVYALHPTGAICHACACIGTAYRMCPACGVIMTQTDVGQTDGAGVGVCPACQRRAAIKTMHAYVVERAWDDLDTALMHFKHCVADPRVVGRYLPSATAKLEAALKVLKG